MKKIITTIACLLLASTFSFAKDESRIGVGLKAAFDYGMMYGFEDQEADDEKDPMGIGFDAGLMFKVKLAKAAYFAPEVNVAYISTSHKYLKKERTYSALDLEIPLLFRGVFLDKIYVTAGPQIVLNLQNDSDIPSMADGTSVGGVNLGNIANAWATATGTKETTEQGFFTMGIAAGIGYNVLGNLNVDFRFYMGLMDLFPDVKALGVDEIEPGDTFTYINMHGAKMMKFNLGVSYWFM